MADFRCPQGHPSQAGDYCDVCGTPIAAAAAAPVVDPAAPVAVAAGDLTLPPPLPPTAASPSSSGSLSSSGLLSSSGAPGGRACPDCGAANLADSLFCESCGYDFTTGQSVRPVAPVADPAAAVAAPTDVAPAVAAPAETNVPAGQPAPQSEPWVVEIWVDPEWYAGQDVPENCPSPGMPQVLILRAASALIGRRSVSRGITPDVDLTSDSGVSRRHAQLTTDGQRWWVEDLQSANGTFVGGGSGLPTNPIEAGRKVELGEDGKIYLGGWTRLVVRAAEPADLVV